jgi:hypothetical protein
MKEHGLPFILCKLNTKFEKLWYHKLGEKYI